MYNAWQHGSSFQQGIPMDALELHLTRQHTVIFLVFQSFVISDTVALTVTIKHILNAISATQSDLMLVD